MVITFLKTNPSIGQCPVLSYSIEDVPQAYLLKGKSSFKAIKILMTDTLKAYRFHIEYFSEDKQKIGTQKFSGLKYKVDLPDELWYSHVLDSTGKFINTLVDLRYSWIPIDKALLNQSEFINLKVSSYSNSSPFILIDTL